MHFTSLIVLPADRAGATQAVAALWRAWICHCAFARQLPPNPAQQFMQAASQASKAMTFIIDRATVRAEAA